MGRWKSIPEMIAEYESNIAVMQSTVDTLIYRADQTPSLTEAFRLRRDANKLSDAVGSSQYAVKLMREYLHG